MKKTIVISGMVFILLFLSACNNTGNTPSEQRNTLNEPPTLYIGSNTRNSSEQDFNAVRLSWTWSVSQKDGNSRTSHADASGPLHLSDYSAITLFISEDIADITLHFSDDYQPLSISAKRWDTKLLGMESDTGFYDEGEPIEVSSSMISVQNDGIDYIYEVYANWDEGNSYYVFRVSLAGE